MSAISEGTALGQPLAETASLAAPATRAAMTHGGRGASLSPPAAATTPVAAALRSVGWLVAAQMVSSGLQFPLSILIARHLGAEDYGRWGFALAFVSLLAVLADFGFSVIVMRDLARDWAGRRLYL